MISGAIADVARDHARAATTAVADVAAMPQSAPLSAASRASRVTGREGFEAARAIRRLRMTRDGRPGRRDKDPAEVMRGRADRGRELAQRECRVGRERFTRGVDEDASGTVCRRSPGHDTTLAGAGEDGCRHRQRMFKRTMLVLAATQGAHQQSVLEVCFAADA